MFINPYLTKKERVLKFQGSPSLRPVFGIRRQNFIRITLKLKFFLAEIRYHPTSGSEWFFFENANKAEESEDEEEIYSRSNVAWIFVLA